MRFKMFIQRKRMFFAVISVGFIFLPVVLLNKPYLPKNRPWEEDVFLRRQSVVPVRMIIEKTQNARVRLKDTEKTDLLGYLSQARFKAFTGCNPFRSAVPIYWLDGVVDALGDPISFDEDGYLNSATLSVSSRNALSELILSIQNRFNEEVE